MSAASQPFPVNQGMLQGSGVTLLVRDYSIPRGALGDALDWLPQITDGLFYECEQWV